MTNKWFAFVALLGFGILGLADSSNNDLLMKKDITLFHASPTTTEAHTPSNTTTPNNDTSGQWKGYLGAAIAVVFFGSTYAPVKKCYTGDGLFYQWAFCSAIWMCGLVINAIQHFPKFYPLAMLGGTSFAIGNLCVIPIIETIGMALGMLIWGSTNLLAGWASGRFGWFGITPEVPSNITMNYIAIALALVSTVIWIFVKPQVSMDKAIEVIRGQDDYRPLVQEVNETESHSSANYSEILSHSTMQHNSWKDRLSTTQKRVLGIVLSLFSGVFYGLSFAPVLHIKATYKDASQTDMDYVFAHFTGVFATSSLFFIIYCIVKKNQPKVYPRVILPGMLSGVMWAIADASWFLANEYLSAAISFPIITTAPGIVASLWGVFVFKEIRGRRNYLVMAVAYAVTITAAVLAGFSKK